MLMYYKNDNVPLIKTPRMMLVLHCFGTEYEIEVTKHGTIMSSEFMCPALCAHTIINCRRQVRASRTRT